MDLAARLLIPNRKMIRRVATSDLTFGHMPAPPPSGLVGEPEDVGVAKILECFTETGMPVDSEALSPIAVVCGWASACDYHMISNSL